MLNKKAIAAFAAGATLLAGFAAAPAFAEGTNPKNDTPVVVAPKTNDAEKKELEGKLAAAKKEAEDLKAKADAAKKEAETAKSDVDSKAQAALFAGAIVVSAGNDQIQFGGAYGYHTGYAVNGDVTTGAKKPAYDAWYKAAETYAAKLAASKKANQNLTEKSNKVAELEAELKALTPVTPTPQRGQQGGQQGNKQGKTDTTAALAAGVADALKKIDPEFAAKLNDAASKISFDGIHDQNATAQESMKTVGSAANHLIPAKKKPADNAPMSKKIDYLRYLRNKIENMLVNLRNQLGDCNNLRHTLPLLKAELADLNAYYKALQTAWTAYYDAREANRFLDQSRDDDEQFTTAFVYGVADVDKAEVEAEQDKTQMLIDYVNAEVKEAEGKLAACKTAVNNFLDGVHKGINTLSNAKDAKKAGKTGKAAAGTNGSAAAGSKTLAKTGVSVALTALAASVLAGVGAAVRKFRH